MLLIADSGSTKCDMVILKPSGERVSSFNIPGINPQHQSEEQIKKLLSQSTEIQGCGAGITKLFFYGAGNSSPDRVAIVEKALKNYFTKAEISVSHDVMASAYATYQGKPHISCILGTGSNSVFFDGKQLTKGTPSLSYIIGDEGSASHIGKKVLTSFFYKSMPDDLAKDFDETYSLSVEELLDKVYRQPQANVYIASFAAFAGKHRFNNFIQKLVSECFNDFLKAHVLSFPQSREVPVSFVGSVAYYFQDVLKDCLKELKLREGVILQKPMDNLIDYHLKYSL